MYLHISKWNLRLFALFFAATALLGCSSFLYYPTKIKYFDPEKTGAKFDDVWFSSEENGAKLHGWYFHNQLGKPPRAVIAFFHGNGENMTSHFATLLWILPEGYDYFIFDYQGYGESEGKPSPYGTVEDGKAALHWLHEHSAGIPLVVYGQSLGGAVAMKTVIDLKDKIPPDLVVVDSTFHSYKAAGRMVLRKSWITWIFQPMTYLVLSDHYAPDGEINKISPIPIVVIHGDKDQVIDYDLGEKVFDLAAEPKEFWKVPGGRHTDSFWRHGTTFRRKFLDKLALIERDRSKEKRGGM